MSEVQDKNILFYNRARKEYEANRPLNYQFSLTKDDPKSRKFRILLNKFVQVFKQGMQEGYKYEIEDSGNYWDELEKNFSDYIQMKYIINRIYESKEVKIRLLFMLLLNNKKLFDFLFEILHRMPYLYKLPEQKRTQLEKELEPVNFFKDGHFTISNPTANYIADFKAFWEAEEANLILFKKEINLLLSEMVEEVQRRQNIRIKAELQMIEQMKREREMIEAKKVKQPEEKKTAQKVVETFSSPEPKTEQKTDDKWKEAVTPQNWDKKPRGMKNSQFLYIKKFKDQLQIFEDKGHPFTYEFHISENNKECAECGKQLSRGLYIFGSDINLCNDTGKWFCNDHMASERIQIPHKAKNEFDLRGYSVSRRSFECIKLYFQMPIIEFRHDEKVVFQHKILYDFLVLKRQLHLMYDSICNTEYMDKTFTKRMNYCLKRNLLSLKNLLDIYNGHEAGQIDKDFAILQRHFYKCEICQTRKGRLCHICNNPPKIFAFQLRDTYSCKHCRNIYHRRCLKDNICPCERQ